MRHERRFVDDEDEDINDFDPAYFPPKGLQGRARAAREIDADGFARRLNVASLYDASHHRPHFADLTMRRFRTGCTRLPRRGTHGSGVCRRHGAAVGPDAAAA